MATIVQRSNRATVSIPQALLIDLLKKDSSSIAEMFNELPLESVSYEGGNLVLTFSQCTKSEVVNSLWTGRTTAQTSQKMNRKKNTNAGVTRWKSKNKR